MQLSLVPIWKKELWTHWRKRDMFHAWKVARKIANNKFGFKTHAAGAQMLRPSAQQWTDHNSVPGNQGGNSAAIIDTTQLETHHQIHFPDANNLNRAQKLFKMMRKRIPSMPKRKAFPHLDIPLELWLIVIRYPKKRWRLLQLEQPQTKDATPFRP